MCRNDGKRPDGLTLIPWQEGKPLVWDATVVTPLAGSDVDRAATGAGVVSDLAADRKLDKYSSLSSAYTIQPIAVDNLGGFSTSTTSFLSELSRRLSSVSNDPNETFVLVPADFSGASTLEFRAFARLFFRLYTRTIAILSIFLSYLF